MSRLDTSPINASAALIREQGFATSYFKRFLDILWERTGGYHDLSDVVETMSDVEYLVSTPSTSLTSERVTTDTSTVSWDHGTPAQAKANVVDGSITTTKLGGDITTAGKALLDDATAADQLTTLGVSAFAQTLLDDANAATALVTLGAMPATTTLDAIPAPVASVEFDQQQALQFVIENRTSDPVSPVPGQLWLRTDL